MRSTTPPRLAVWLLEHLIPGERNDALAGDLLEEFRSGRSAAWYWRQVLSCIAITNTRVVKAHAAALLFAGLWALLGPAWFPLARLGTFPRLDHAILNLAWPWSAICHLGLAFFFLISFVWAGLLLYLVLESLTVGRFSFSRLRRGITRSAAVFAPLWMAAWSLRLIFPGFAISLPRSAVRDRLAMYVLTKPDFLVICAPFFATLIWAIWDVSRTKIDRIQQLRKPIDSGRT